MNTPDTEDWEKAFDARFTWEHTPEGRGYLYDNAGQQTVDEVIMKDFIENAITSRDTYWNERVRGEVANAVRDEQEMKLYNFLGHPVLYWVELQKRAIELNVVELLEEIASVKFLLSVATCPDSNCNKEGVCLDGYGDPYQCEWCCKRKETLDTLLDNLK